jgi:hypothetical protein
MLVAAFQQVVDEGRDAGSYCRVAGAGVRVGGVDGAKVLVQGGGLAGEDAVADPKVEAVLRQSGRCGEAAEGAAAVADVVDDQELAGRREGFAFEAGKFAGGEVAVLLGVVDRQAQRRTFWMTVSE